MPVLPGICGGGIALAALQLRHCHGEREGTGLYIHLEELKKPFLARHFDSAEGNLYEGTVSDFTPSHRGTMEKKTNEDEDDWTDVDAVMAALQDPSDSGLATLGEIVDLDRFLTFWATEVLVGHWDGYAGDRNNYHFYREPEGKFVFLPWGADDTFHLKDDPNPFDNISNPPPSVLALSAIPNRLYNHTEWRTKYVARLKDILNTAWDEEELLASVDEIAAIVQANALPENLEAAAADTKRVRKFILKRKGEILADLTPEPPDWPEPDEYVATSGVGESGTIEVDFESTWGSNESENPFAGGKVTRLLLNENEESVDDLAILVGNASADEHQLLPNAGELASLSMFSVGVDGTVTGMTIVLPLANVAAGATLVIGEDPIAGGVWTVPPGASAPDSFTPWLRERWYWRRLPQGTVRSYPAVSRASMAKAYLRVPTRPWVALSPARWNCAPRPLGGQTIKQTHPRRGMSLIS